MPLLQSHQQPTRVYFISRHIISPEEVKRCKVMTPVMLCSQSPIECVHHASDVPTDSALVFCQQPQSSRIWRVHKSHDSKESRTD
eukprot:scaffold58852_cov16-Prasinocladus_malaysianus.AAC.2